MKEQQQQLSHTPGLRSIPRTEGPVNKRKFSAGELRNPLITLEDGNTGDFSRSASREKSTKYAPILEWLLDL
jgi:hypothetical protein